MTDRLIEDLLAVGRRVANQHGYRLHVEHSYPTEAVYLRVQRKHHWFGLRIAAHEPGYECSADFQQLLVPVTEAGTEFRRLATQTVESSVRSGGFVVAGPERRKSVPSAIGSTCARRGVTKSKPARLTEH